MNPEGTVYNAQGRVNRLSVLCIDAYGVAVKNGFKGTVEEWLASLKGEKGDPGEGSSIKDRYTGHEFSMYMEGRKLYVEEVAE